MPSLRTLLAVLLATAPFALAQQPHKIDDLALRDAGKSGSEWLTYGLTQGETRYSPLTQINASNVSKLGLAWSYDLGNGGGGQEDTPLIWDGKLYGITNWSVVFALDARTGKQIWRWDPEVNQPATRAKICCGVVNRGVAIYNGKIIAPIIDGRLVALDAITGKPVWESRVAYPQENYTITMAPRIAKGRVIIGVAGGELLIRGHFDAFDADTGAFAWRFYTVPGDPSKGFENAAMKKASATWGGEWWKLGGGAPVWDGMAYDPEADLFYVGTGNGGPWPEQLRQSKGKDNLYVCSILAVKPETGELKWYFQAVPGDSWDFDAVQQLMLADITIKGKQRKVLMQASKNGFYYVLDRITGQFISGAPFSQVTWAKGLDEVTGKPLIIPEAHYDQDVVTLTPGPAGAHNWSPMSFNPKTGLVYIPINTTSPWSFAIDKNFTIKPGRSNIGIAAGARPAPNKPALPSIGPTPEKGQSRALIAWDPVTETERWRSPEGGSVGGGTLSTASNLVLQVTPDGKLIAYTADKGEKLAEINTGLGGGMSPPITYELDGKQYVTVLGGSGRIVPRYQDAAPLPAIPGAPPDLAGPPPSNAPVTAPKMMTFVLDGKPLQ
jgi:quinohemoprotein ethanol dehydrogenase